MAWSRHHRGIPVRGGLAAPLPRADLIGRAAKKAKESAEEDRGYRCSRMPSAAAKAFSRPRTTSPAGTPGIPTQRPTPPGQIGLGARCGTDAKDLDKL